MSRALRGLCLSLLMNSAYALGQEAWPTPDWTLAAEANSADWRAVQAYAFADRDEHTRQGIRTDALLVIKDGRIVYEHYAAPTTAGTPHLSWSISKSVLATVLGVAQREGRFALNDRVAGFYAPMQAHPEVRVEDLLHWASVFSTPVVTATCWRQRCEPWSVPSAMNSIHGMRYSRRWALPQRFESGMPAVRWSVPPTCI